MSTVFEGKLRRLGNSMAVVIPKKVLEETGAKGGRRGEALGPIPRRRCREVLKTMVGIDVMAVLSLGKEPQQVIETVVL